MSSSIYTTNVFVLPHSEASLPSFCCLQCKIVPHYCKWQKLGDKPGNELSYILFPSGAFLSTGTVLHCWDPAEDIRRPFYLDDISKEQWRGICQPHRLLEHHVLQHTDRAVARTTGMWMTIILKLSHYENVQRSITAVFGFGNVFFYCDCGMVCAHLHILSREVEVCVRGFWVMFTLRAIPT